MLEKIKNLVEHPRARHYLKQLQDVRVLGLIIFVAIVLLTSWSGIKAIQTNYELEKQVAGLQQQNQVQQLANGNLKLKNQYYDTNQFLELQARRQFGLGAPGEKLVLIPKKVALAHAANLTVPSAQTVAASKSQPWYRRNLQAWLDFMLHRPQSAN